MAPKLYMMIPSPPVRAVLLCAKSLEIEFEKIEIDILNNEHLSPNFIKLNPLHTIPTLVDDDGFVLCDSHVIMGYLVDKYGKDKSLYPKDLRKRAIIDQRLHFDSAILYIRGLKVARSIAFHEVKKISQEAIESIQEAYGFLEAYLSNSKWVAGNEMSIADFSAVTTITTWNVFAPVEESTYPKITAWVKQMEKLPYYNEVNATGHEIYASIIRSKLSE